MPIPNRSEIPACIGIGLSAGGLPALKAILPLLPENFAAPVLVVQHILGKTPSQLEYIFSRICNIHVTEAREGDRILPSRVLFAPPDYHMAVNHNHRIVLIDGPNVKYCKPAIDPLFKSIAAVYGRNSMGMVLTGTNDDGAEGLLAISRAGGRTVIQNPETAEFKLMPKSAAKLVKADFTLNLEQFAPFLKSLV